MVNFGEEAIADSEAEDQSQAKKDTSIPKDTPPKHRSTNRGA